jgi:hypothetical protein
MDAYVQEVRKLESKFSGLEVHHVLREHNVGADILSKTGSTRLGCRLHLGYFAPFRLPQHHHHGLGIKFHSQPVLGVLRECLHRS